MKMKTVLFSTAYGIYSNASPGFDYTTSYFYSLLINCDDIDPANTQQKNFYVFLTKNNAPVVSNLQGKTTFSRRLLTTFGLFLITLTR